MNKPFSTLPFGGFGGFGCRVACAMTRSFPQLLEKIEKNFWEKVKKITYNPLTIVDNWCMRSYFRTGKGVTSQKD